MKIPRSRTETDDSSPVGKALPLMSNVAGKMPVIKAPLEQSIDISGTVKDDLNVVNIRFDRRGSVPVSFGANAFRAFLRLVADVKLRGTSSIVTALDLQREGVVPWGTARATMTEVFESIATSVGGDAAEHILGVLVRGLDYEKQPWTRLTWNFHIEILFGVERQASPLSSIRQRLSGTEQSSGDKAFLSANGWRADFDYLHGYTTVSECPDGDSFAYDLVCPVSSLRYDRAALLRHDDELIRRIVAILPV
jgi:hypothetical protein